MSRCSLLPRNVIATRFYDDDYREEVEDRLRDVKRTQPVLDCPITTEKVFVAIRRMGMGKAHGVDGVLSMHAAGAVGTNKLKGG